MFMLIEFIGNAVVFFLNGRNCGLMLIININNFPRNMDEICIKNLDRLTCPTDSLNDRKSV